MSSSVSPVSSLSAYSGNYFNGLSNYSQDLNNSISRELQIAQLPIQLLQNNVSTLNGQVSEMQTLSGNLGSVQSAIATLNSAVANPLLASLSDSSVATATLAAGATPASYSLQVTNLGSYSDALSVDGLPTVTDPTAQSISSSGSYSLTVGNVTTTIAYAGGNLNGLAAAINQANAGVQATVLDVGSDQAPAYRLSLQSAQYGDVSMQLNDGNRDLLEASGPAGAPVQYSINGHSVSTGSRTVTVAAGLTLDLTGTSTDGADTLTVGLNANGIGNALSYFVSTYNIAMTELGKNRGQGTGALLGQSIVYQLTDALQAVPNYSTGAGIIASLAGVGLTFEDTTGTLSFDQGKFNSATSGQTDALMQFLGSATGGGFLEAATNALNSFLDPSTGALTQAMTTLQSSVTNTNSQISSEQASVAQLQTDLTHQMSAADAAIYELQQQASEMQDMFTAMRDSQIANGNG